MSSSSLVENRTFDNIFGGPNPFGSGCRPDWANGRWKNDKSVSGHIELKRITSLGDPNNITQTGCLRATRRCGLPAYPSVGRPSPCLMNGFNLNAHALPARRRRASMKTSTLT